MQVRQYPNHCPAMRGLRCQITFSKYCISLPNLHCPELRGLRYLTISHSEYYSENKLTRKIWLPRHEWMKNWNKALTPHLVFGCMDGLITVTGLGLIVIKYPAHQFHFTWSGEAWSADTSRIPCFIVRLKNIIVDLKCWNSYRDNVIV